MSQTGLAKLCGVTKQAISKLLSSMSTFDDENPLKAILDEALHLTTWKTEKGREIKIIRSTACVKIIRYYDRQGNKIAQQTLDKFAAMGIDAWIQGITGWKSPRQEFVDSYRQEHHILQSTEDRSAAQKTREQQELYWLTVKGSYTNASVESLMRKFRW